ncbi:MAG: hypothetical protein CSA81_05370 [Acidobacteria bacterium]|nr:MAG: hypothetical protein CSA81_05370 [Acidobacteriota bacterium]
MFSLQKKYTIKKLISFSFIAIALVTILATYLTLRYMALPVIKSGNEAYFQQYCDQVTLRISKELQAAEVLATAMASIGESLMGDSMAVEQTLPPLLNSKRSFVNLVAGGGIWPEPYQFDTEKKKSSFFWGRQENGELKFYDDYNYEESEDYHEKAWYVPGQFLPEGECFWSQAYKDPYSHETMVTCTAPIWKDDEFLGVATVDINLEGFAEFISSQHIFNDGEGHIYVLDRNHQLLSCPHGMHFHDDLSEDVFHTVDDILPLYEKWNKSSREFHDQLMGINQDIVSTVQKLNIKTDQTASLLQKGSRLSAEDALLTASILEVNKLDRKSGVDLGIKKVKMVDPFETNDMSNVYIFLIPKTYWRIVATVPLQRAERVLNYISRGLVFIFFICLVFPLTALFVFFNRLVLKPLQSLTNQLKLVENTSFNDTLKLDYEGENELNTLVRVFNRRADKLKAFVQELEISEANYKAIFDGVNEGIFIHDMESDSMIEANQSLLDMYQIKSNMNRKFNLFDYSRTGSLSAPAHTNGYLEKAKRGESQVFEWEMEDQNGRSFWVEVSLKKAEFSKRHCILGVVRDISIRKKAELDNKHLKDYMYNIINFMPSIIIGIDTKRNVTLWNRKALETTSLTYEYAVGQPVEKVLPMIKGQLIYISNALRHGYPVLDHRFVHNKGEIEQHYNLTVFPLSLPTISGAVIRIDHITEQVRNEQKLIQAQKMDTVGTLAGGLAHDFNNILGGITGSLSMLELVFKSSPHVQVEDIKKYISFITTSTDRAKEMVNRLLTLSKKQKFTEEPVDIRQSIHNVVDICKNSFDKSVRIETDFPEESVTAMVDPTQIEQVFLNLFVNAEHAMTHMREKDEKWGGVLFVGIEKHTAEPDFKHRHSAVGHDPYWKITVRDSGIGISQEIMTYIFNPFFTTKEQNKGSGLGLSMVYNIVTQHKGVIDVKSEEGVGTTFEVYLPVVNLKPKAQSRAANNTQFDRLEGKVLVVDDEELIREIATEMMASFGLEVVTACHGREALDLLDQEDYQFDFVLLDMVMPVLSGMETFREIKKNKPDMVIVMSSGFKADQRVETVLQEGADGFIQKPYNIRKLYQFCRQFF